MAQFRYKAQDATGKKVKGSIRASDEAEVQRLLHEQNLYLISASETSERKTTQQFKPKILADFSRQLSTLVGAGVTLVRALTIISDGEAVKPKERKVYEDMIRQIRQGIALSNAMEAQEGAFPPLMIHMYRSAETSGNLEKVALQMALLYEKEHKLEGKISTSLLYPKILGILVIAVVLIITKFVMPQLQELFDTMGTLPLPTRILLGFSDIMEDYWYLAIAVLLLLWVGAKMLLRIASVRKWWHTRLIKMPVFGPLQKVICTSRFARTLSSLYAAGIPIVPSLQVARKTIGNDYIDEQFDAVIPHVRAGNNLSDGLEMVDGFVRKLTDSIRVGEETGSLDSMLLSTAESMEFDADIAIDKMVAYVEPVMMIIMGIVVGFVLVAVFTALYGSYDSISNMG